MKATDEELRNYLEGIYVDEYGYKKGSTKLTALIADFLKCERQEIEDLYLEEQEDF